jgi:periplasmic copper chaperone A
MIKLRFAALAALLTLSACSSGHEPDKAGIEVENAWARLPALPDRPGAAYFTLRNYGAGAVLTGVQSPRVQRIELHDEAMTGSGMGGMMHMTPLTEVAISQGSTAAFQPGGKHAMLFGMDPKLKEGGQLPLTFVFRDGHRIDAQAKLVAVGAPAP